MEILVPLADLDFDDEESQAVLDVLNKRWLTMGAVTQEFEIQFAKMANASGGDFENKHGFYTEDVINHEYFVRRASTEGKPVPAEVLADYPDLKPSVQKPAPVKAPAEQPLPGEAGEKAGYFDVKTVPKIGVTPNKPPKGKHEDLYGVQHGKWAVSDSWILNKTAHPSLRLLPVAKRQVKAGTPEGYMPETAYPLLPPSHQIEVYGEKQYVWVDNKGEPTISVDAKLFNWITRKLKLNIGTSTKDITENKALPIVNNKGDIVGIVMPMDIPSKADIAPLAEKETKSATKPRKGFRPGYVDITPVADAIDKVVSSSESVISETKKQSKSITKEIDKLIGVVSTRMGNIHPEIKRRQRRVDFEEMVNTARDMEQVVPFVRQAKKMSKADRKRLLKFIQMFMSYFISNCLHSCI